MAVKIKLARFGKIREPYYRVVVADARTRRGGRTIELVGKYHPKAEPSVIDIDSDRVQYWLGVGAQPTDPVVALLKVTGDWQKFKGLPGTEGTLKPQPEKVDKRARYEAAMAAVGGDDAPAATARKRAPKKAEAVEPAATEAAEPVASAAAEPAETAGAAAAPVADAPADVEPVAALVPDASDVDAPATVSPFGAGSHAALADDAQPEGFPIKGNASSKLYHVPESPFYDRTIAEVWFASADAAEQAGFALPKSQQADDEPAGDTA